jgi:hypothetical protein
MDKFSLFFDAKQFAAEFAAATGEARAAATEVRSDAIMRPDAGRSAPEAVTRTPLNDGGS